MKSEDLAALNKASAYLREFVGALTEMVRGELRCSRASCTRDFELGPS